MPTNCSAYAGVPWGTAPRMTALSPGQSPPLVRMPIVIAVVLAVSGEGAGDAATPTLAPASRGCHTARGRASVAAQRLPQQVAQGAQLHRVARGRVHRHTVQCPQREALLGVDELGDLRVDRVRGDDAPCRDGLVLADA